MDQVWMFLWCNQPLKTYCILLALLAALVQRLCSARPPPLLYCLRYCLRYRKTKQAVGIGNQRPTMQHDDMRRLWMWHIHGAAYVAGRLNEMTRSSDRLLWKTTLPLDSFHWAWSCNDIWFVVNYSLDMDIQRKYLLIILRPEHGSLWVSASKYFTFISIHWFLFCSLHP